MSEGRMGMCNFETVQFPNIFLLLYGLIETLQYVFEVIPYFVVFQMVIKVFAVYIYMNVCIYTYKWL